MRILAILFFWIWIPYFVIAQEALEKTTFICYKVDRLDLNAFWLDHPSVYASVLNDTGDTYKFIWIERQHGVRISRLTISEVGDSFKLLKTYMNDSLIGEKKITFDAFRKQNIQKCLTNLGAGKFMLISPLLISSDASDSAYFVYYKKQEVFALFSNVAKLSVIPTIDKALAINAIGTLEAFFSYQKDGH
jgi:hypothetical protein